VLDNCQIHHAKEIRQLVEEEACKSFAFPIDSCSDTWAVCKLVVLPLYLLDYNPIKQAFSSIKAFLGHHWMDKSLSIIGQACQNITFEKAAGYF
jgi:transposase